MWYHCILAASTSNMFAYILRCSVPVWKCAEYSICMRSFFWTYRLLDIEDINEAISSWSVAFAIMAMWFLEYYVPLEILEFGKIHGNHQPLVGRSSIASNGFMRHWNILFANLLRMFIIFQVRVMRVRIIQTRSRCIVFKSGFFYLLRGKWTQHIRVWRKHIMLWW